MNPLVIYHAACRDGFCAAWVASRFLGDADFHPAYHGQPPPDVTSRDHVYVIDFCYPRPEMEMLAKQCGRLFVLDHHKTAQEALAGFAAPNVKVVFDMNRSGAGIAWDWFASSPGAIRPRPWIVNYVEDRDLWRHRLRNTEVLNALISVLPFEFDAWDKMAARDPADLDVIAEGRAVVCKTGQYVREVAKNARMVMFEGHKVPLVNAPQVDISELLAHLAETNDGFAMGWWQRGDGFYAYSLRATESRGLDVSELAKRYGGGGHAKAAGFQSQTPIHMDWPVAT